MTGSKHPKATEPTDADLQCDPGIGTSKGATGTKGKLDGENTFKGDVLNDTTPEGGVDPEQRGRENK